MTHWAELLHLYDLQCSPLCNAFVMKVSSARATKNNAEKLVAAPKADATLVVELERSLMAASARKQRVEQTLVRCAAHVEAVQLAIGPRALMQSAVRQRHAEHARQHKQNVRAVLKADVGALLRSAARATRNVGQHDALDITAVAAAVLFVGNRRQNGVRSFVALLGGRRRQTVHFVQFGAPSRHIESAPRRRRRRNCVGRRRPRTLRCCQRKSQSHNTSTCVRCKMPPRARRQTNILLNFDLRQINTTN